MNSVILITDSAVTLQDLFQKLQSQWPKTYSNPLGGFVVEDDEDHVYVEPYDNAEQEYEPEKLERLRKLMSSPRFFGIDYSNRDFVKRILLSFTDDPRIVVDNEAGTVLPGPAFVRRLREEPGWDWFEEYGRGKGKDNEAI